MPLELVWGHPCLEVHNIEQDDKTLLKGPYILSSVFDVCPVKNL